MLASRSPSRSMIVAAFLALALACSEEATVAPESAPSEAEATPPSRTRAGQGPLVVFLGDSLTAGYGLSESEAFPALLGRLLAASGRPVRVVNAGVSGDTSAGGLRRLPWLLDQHPDVLVVALGANDGLRGLPVEHTEANLRAIVTTASRRDVRVLLLGLRLPPNLGSDYGEAFASLYPRVARETGAALVPYFLEGVGGVRELNQGDGIHPTAEGQERIATTILPPLLGLLSGD